MVAGPKLILADEPTGNLDSKNGKEVMDLLTDLNRNSGATIVMVTHSQHDASFAHHAVRERRVVLRVGHHHDASFAHRVVNLFDGEIVTDIKNRL